MNKQRESISWGIAIMVAVALGLIVVSGAIALAFAWPNSGQLYFVAAPYRQDDYSAEGVNTARLNPLDPALAQEAMLEDRARDDNFTTSSPPNQVSPTATRSVSTGQPSSAPTNTLLPAQTNTPQWVFTKTPSPVPTNTRVPALSNTPKSLLTNTPSSVVTSTPGSVPSNTPVQVPTNTTAPAVTNTPDVPTSTQPPTNTLVSTNTKSPTKTLVPTNTKPPTNTPAPTNTKSPVKTPAPTNTKPPTKIPAPTNTKPPTKIPAPTPKPPKTRRPHFPFETLGTPRPPNMAKQNDRSVTACKYIITGCFNAPADALHFLDVLWQFLYNVQSYKLDFFERQTVQFVTATSVKQAYSS